MRASSRLAQLRESMWFVPGLMVLVALVLAQAIISVDLWLDEHTVTVLPSSFLIGVEGSRGILVTVGGSVLAVAATTFSITMSVIATASSTYGPRLVRNFMTDRSNQRVLGLFVATFVYCLMVLRRVQDASDGVTFVPYVAVYGALVLALLSVGALVYFLHHISDVIQVSTLVRRVRGELERTVEGLYGQAAESRAPAAPLASASAVVLADRAGFITAIDAPGLVAAATDVGAAEMLVGPGTHVMVGEPLARVTGDAEAMSRVVLRHVSLGATRTPTQDVRFALQQMVEMAVRAVSPSTNDPYTARNVIEELACGLVPAVRDGDQGAGWVDDTGTVRLVWRLPSGTEMVDFVFDDLRVYAAGDPGVVTAAIQLAERVLRVCGTAVAARVGIQLDELLAAAERSGMADIDLGRLREQRERLAPAAGRGRTTREASAEPR